MKDSLGDRMKDYEMRTRSFLPRRGYTLIRLDGKAFHSYTRPFQKPFDDTLIEAMDRTAAYLCENIQGVVMAYVQSDEITLLLCDFKKITSAAWFDGNIQKIVSVSVAMATAKFLESMRELRGDVRLTAFDSRVWFLADPVEVENTLIWRQRDAIRNSIHLVAQSLYSHKVLHGKNTQQLLSLIEQKGVNWNSYPVGKQRGRTILRELYEKDGTTRSRWVTVETPIFSKDRSFLQNIIPLMNNWL